METNEKIYYIGIDPDVKKSGVAVWNTDNKRFVRLSGAKDNEMEIPIGMERPMEYEDLREFLICWKPTIIKVRLEAGWLLNKSNWHYKRGQSRQFSERQAKNVGENHHAGKSIEKLLKRLGIDFELVKPQGKLDEIAFERLTKIHTLKSHQDSRDAAMLVFEYHKIKNKLNENR